MIKCKKCQKTMVFRQINPNQIMLVCSDPTCGFQSTLIDNSQEHSFAQEPPITSSQPNPHIKKIGNVEGVTIYCIDFSTRMDVQLPHNDKDLQDLRNRIREDPSLPEDVKNAMADLLEEPISYFNGVVLAFSFLLKNTINAIESTGFQGFHVVAMCGDVDEIFRFPAPRSSPSMELVLDFIGRMKIKRHEFLMGSNLEFRDFSLVISRAAEIRAEIDAVVPGKTVQIVFITAGEHKTRSREYVNPIRLINDELGSGGNFTFNIIDLNPSSNEAVFKELAKKFRGYYTRECTLKAIINSITYKEFGTDPLVPRDKIKPLDGIPSKLEINKVPVPAVTPGITIKLDNQAALASYTTSDKLTSAAPAVEPPYAGNAVPQLEKAGTESRYTPDQTITVALQKPGMESKTEGKEIPGTPAKSLWTFSKVENKEPDVTSPQDFQVVSVTSQPKRRQTDTSLKNEPNPSIDTITLPVETNTPIRPVGGYLDIGQEYFLKKNEQLKANEPKAPEIKIHREADDAIAKYMTPRKEGKSRAK
nr:hypothetical protein [Candidatus Sigynarchaeota archaeon]